MVCTNCGKELKEGIKFCPYCGKSVGSEKGEVIKSETLSEDRKNPVKKTVVKQRIIICVSVVMFIIAAFISISMYNTTEKRIQRQLDLGYKYLENQQYEEACLACEKAIGIDDKCIEAYAMLIHAYEHMDSVEIQKEFYDKALNIVRKLDKEKFAENMDYIIEIYLAASNVYGDEMTKVAELLEEGLEAVGDAKIKENLIENYFKQTEIYEQEGDYEKSLEIYDRLLELKKEDGQIFANLRNCLSKYLVLLAEAGNYDRVSELTEKYKGIITDIDYEGFLARKDTDNEEMELAEESNLEQSDDKDINGTSADWYNIYQDFILNREYLTSGQEYGYDFGSYLDPIVSLYDLDRDGVPELLITNGYSARTDRWAYIYTCENNKIKYLDIGPTDAFIVENSEYSGIYGCYGGGEFNWTYYWKEGDTIGNEYVFQECYGVAGDDTVIIQQTDNDKLFAESQKEKIGLYGANVSEIVGIGWEYFVVLTGI